jgi:hypothetical protein
MPFTISHPALVLPAKYLPAKWVSMTGLIVGSITPDFEYFMRMKVESIYSHTWAGMFWFDLPLSLLITFVYHYIVRDSFICNSPRFLKRRLSRYMDFNWMDYFRHNFFTVLICLLVGIASHIFWDSFTHPRGDFVKIIPYLKETSTIDGFRIPNYRIMQNLSTLVGGIIVFISIMSIPRAKEYAPSRNPFYYWFIVIGTGLAAVNIRMITGTHYWEYVTIATAALSGFIAGTIIAPLFLEKKVVKV